MPNYHLKHRCWADERKLCAERFEAGSDQPGLSSRELTHPHLNQDGQSYALARRTRCG